MSDPAGISAWLRIDERITTSGQPTEPQLAMLRALGVAHVVNLALHSHPKALRDERASVEALGMEYIHIPVEFDNPTEADFATFHRVMEARRHGRVHIHCIVNARVSAFMYKYRRDGGHVGVREARAAMETIWRPGGVWAALIGDQTRIDSAHEWVSVTP